MKRVNLDVDKIISKLLSVRNMPQGTEVDLEEKEIRALTVLARDIFIKQPILIEIDAPVKICGKGSRGPRHLYLTSLYSFLFYIDF